MPRLWQRTRGIAEEPGAHLRMPRLRSSDVDHGWHSVHRSKLPLTVWFWAAHLMATHSNGMSALQFEAQLGITYKTAWLLAQKLRRSMIDPQREPLEGVVEVDQADHVLNVNLKGSCFCAQSVTKTMLSAGRQGSIINIASGAALRAPLGATSTSCRTRRSPLRSTDCQKTTFERAFPDGIRVFNRPTNVRFGPDGCAYVVDYGAVRDNGQSDPATKFQVVGDGPLVQFPGTGVIWKICPSH